MKTSTNLKKINYHNFYKEQAIIIEKTLNSFGLKTMITEINIEKDYIEYCLQVVVGLSLDELEKHSRDLALALASPTGKIKMIIPIPGKSLVAIQVPKPTEETLKKMLENEKVEKTTLRKIISNIFTLIGALFFTLGEKIENK